VPNTNLLLTKRKGCTREYWSEVVAVQTEHSEVRTETTEGQYSPVWLELAKLVSSLLYDAVASWLVRSFLDRAVRVRALAGDIVLCSWARHFTFTVPLST